jgi:hypothetical protein
MQKGFSTLLGLLLGITIFAVASVYSYQMFFKSSGIIDGGGTGQSTKDLMSSIPKIEKSEFSSCITEADCACGKSTTTNQCAFGNRQYIDTTQQCPDFCSGITGRLKLVCKNNICVQQ